MTGMAWCMSQKRASRRGDLIERWGRERQANPDASRIILTHTNDEVRSLNEAAREKMRDAGHLGDEVRVSVERGAPISGRRHDRLQGHALADGRYGQQPATRSAA
jgi:hypothetical protein